MLLQWLTVLEIASGTCWLWHSVWPRLAAFWVLLLDFSKQQNATFTQKWALNCLSVFVCLQLFMFCDSHESVSATSCIARIANVSCDRWVKWRVVAAMRNCASRRQHHRRTVQACVSRWSVGVTCPFAHCLACRKQATSVWKIWHAVTTWTSQICHHGITCVFA